jgi:hypothetical protein
VHARLTSVTRAASATPPSRAPNTDQQPSSTRINIARVVSTNRVVSIVGVAS